MNPHGTRQGTDSIPPPAVARLLEALAEGRPDDAADAFAGDALYAYPDGHGEETAARSTAYGRDAIRRALAAGGPECPEPLLCIHDGADCFLEGGLTDTTFAASLQLDAAGAIARYLSFRCPAVESSPTWRLPASPAAAARPAVERYLRHLSAGDFAEACACFSEDCVYSHPPYRLGAPRAAFRGRSELHAGFEESRGRTPARPAIVCCIQRGSNCFIEGVVDGILNGGSFVSSVTLDREGLIRRYVAFYTKSRVPRRAG